MRGSTRGSSNNSEFVDDANLRRHRGSALRTFPRQQHIRHRGFRGHCRDDIGNFQIDVVTTGAVNVQGKRMALAEQLPQFEAHERAYNKLARTFTTQMEALRKHRNGGKQTVTVQHVNVADGGQAIVGDVATRGAGNDKG